MTERIAASHGVKPEQVLFGCGSTELMRAAACAFLGSGRQLIQASPTYEAPEDYARSLGAEVVSVPLDQRHAHDLHAMLDRASAATGLIYICNPNNPTATITPRREIETFIGKLPSTTKVLIDEAYHHYVAPSGMYASFIDRPLGDERVIVTRTFSKVYGLAGTEAGLRGGVGGDDREHAKIHDPELPQCHRGRSCRNRHRRHRQHSEVRQT